MLTPAQIQFLNLTCPNKWKEENNVIVINNYVNISFRHLTQIPVQFSIVEGSFSCHSNKLTTLKGSPYIVKNYFDCNRNQLTSLEGGPKMVRYSYSCSINLLTNLIGAPEICYENFFCVSNQLTSLEGGPSIINGDLWCNKNPLLKYLWGIGRVERKVFYDNRNEINEWIIECMQKDIIFPHFTLEENINWIKATGHYSCLFRAPKEIRKMFSKYELNYVDALC